MDEQIQLFPPCQLGFSFRLSGVSSELRQYGTLLVLYFWRPIRSWFGVMILISGSGMFSPQFRLGGIGSVGSESTSVSVEFRLNAEGRGQ